MARMLRGDIVWPDLILLEEMSRPNEQRSGLHLNASSKALMLLRESARRSRTASLFSELLPAAWQSRYLRNIRHTEFFVIAVPPD